MFPRACARTRISARDRNHGRLRRTDQPKRAPAHLDIAAFELGVTHLGRPGHDLTGNEDDALGTETTRQLESLWRREIRIERDLNDPGAIAEVDEHETTEVSPSMHPSSKAHTCSDVFDAERPTERVAERRLERYGRTHSGSHRLTPGGITPRAKAPATDAGAEVEGALEVSASRARRGLRR